MLDKLFINYEETVSVILFCIGFSTMLLNKNLIKEVLEAPKETQFLIQGFMAGLNVSQTARKPA